MLRLEKLEMLGFKSFYARTEFLFEKNITAIVGPNGCGKSNIGDALNWVIGEQSVKSLRGDRMEDVIFNGSEGRKPLGMAEVSLHLKNGRGSDTEESVVITRRLFRSGESEYLINGQRCRLRDIQESLARINVGSGVYSIIEQGKVDAALSSRPRERRVLIEEAAGIAMYKTKKRQAETKLEATEANLLRVNDVVSELERQIGSLKRQAARARRYSRTEEEIARLDRILLYHDHHRLEGERRQVEDRETEARSHESEAAARLGSLEARYEEGRRSLEEQEEAWRRCREDLHTVDREMDHHGREKTLAREQASEALAGMGAARELSVSLEGRLAEVTGNIEQRRLDRTGVERDVDEKERERERLEGARHELDTRIDGLESDLAGARSAFLQIVDAGSDARNRRRQATEAREKLGRQEAVLTQEESDALMQHAERQRARGATQAALASAEAEAGAIAARLQSGRSEMERIEEALRRETARRDEARHRLQGHEERLRALEELDASSGGAKETLAGLVSHEGILAEGIRVPANLEASVEQYLGDRLDAALVADTQHALDGVSCLKQAGKGRASFLPLPGAEEAAHPVIALPEELRDDPAFQGRLLDLMETDAGRRVALSPLLARAVVVTDLDAAARLRRRAPMFDYLTLDGDILHLSGLVEGGARRPEGAGALSRRRAKQDLLEAIETGRARLAEMDRLIAGLEADRAGALANVRELSEAVAESDKGLVARRLEMQSAVDDEERAREKAETVTREKSMASEEAIALDREIVRLDASLVGLEEARRVKETAIAASQQEIVDLRATMARLGESLTVVRSALSAGRQRLEAIDTDLARLLESDQELRDRIETERSREAELTQRREAALARETESAAALETLGSRRRDLEALVREGEVALSEKRIESERMGHEVKEARGQLEEARGRREGITLEKERIAADLRHLVADALDGADRTLEEILAGVTEEDKARDLDELRAAVTELREKLRRIGPVNMMALDQFRELEERFTFMSAQRKDLTEAIASLKETIARINRTSRERFLEAFEKIRAGFGETFRSLFGGGRADLRLMTDNGDEDVLECGMEIIAQPPGKRLQSVTLLSGGEKALTAIALLFAIFHYRPSPFCLLDEVDAPLDESNVIRFNSLLDSMASSTQFVMITHNRRSMDAADMLYGITMDEPGISRAMSVVLDGRPDREQAVRTLPAILAARHKGNGRRAVLATATGGDAGAGASGGNREGPRADGPSSPPSN